MEDQLLSKQDLKNLLETAKWGKFLGIVGFVFTGLMVFVGLMMFAVPDMGLMMPTSVLSLIYMLLSLFYFFPSLYLYRFSIKIRSGIHNGEMLERSAAFENMKKLFLFMGIVTIVLLAFYVLIFFFGLLGGMLGGLMGTYS
ncbi:MAG: hypothetical protein Tsb0034_03850 [Ekhidna sp.]